MLRQYSSISAFLAHYRALSGAARRPADAVAPLNPEERTSLAEMERLMGELAPAERDLLAEAEAGAADASKTASVAPASAAASALRRRRDRAELKLARVLAAHGILTG